MTLGLNENEYDYLLIEERSKKKSYQSVFAITFSHFTSLYQS